MDDQRILLQRGNVLRTKYGTAAGGDYLTAFFAKILGNLSADAGSSSKMVCLLDKVTLADDQVLRIYIYEDGGSRNLNLSLIPKDVNGARGDRL